MKQLIFTNMRKSSTAYLFECYIWLVNTIAHGPISREAIDDKWARSSVNVFNMDSIPETTFHRWRNIVELLFDVTIKCNSDRMYYIEDMNGMDCVDWRSRMFNLFAVNTILKDCKNLRDQILFEPVPSGERFLTTTIEAMRDKCVLKVTYQGFSKEKATTFLVEPYCLKMYKLRWYLLGFSHGLDKIRIYSLDRIQSMEQTAQKYKLPKGFDAEAYFKHTFGVSGMELPPQTIEIRVQAFEANYFRALPLHDSQTEVERNEDYSVFKYTIVPTFEFIQELRRQGAKLEVLSPQWLRDDFGKEAAALLNIYK